MKLGDLIRLFDFVRSECKYYLMVPKISFWIEFVDANLPYVTSFTNAPTNLWFEPRVKKIIIIVTSTWQILGGDIACLSNYRIKVQSRYFKFCRKINQFVFRIHSIRTKQIMYFHIFLSHFLPMNRKLSANVYQ